MTAKKGKGSVKANGRNNTEGVNGMDFILLIFNEKKPMKTFLVMVNKPEH
ncbi:hypothetical protein PPNK14_38640 [Pectobacterium parmentieri]